MTMRDSGSPFDSCSSSAGLRFRRPVRGRKRIWNFSASSNLYVLKGQPTLYKKAVENPHYFRHLDQPLAETIEKSLAISQLTFSNVVQLVDLGPGDALKSLTIAEHVRKRTKQLIYSPVDISPIFLQLACKRVGRLKGVRIKSYLELFESLSRKDFQSVGRAQLVLSIGPTFMNFEGAQICRLLSGLMAKGDRCLICAQYRDTSLEDAELLEPYKTPDVMNFNFSILEYLGFKSGEVSYFARLNKNCIEMGFTVRTASVYLQSLDFRPGDIILTARSNRYSLARYKSLLKSVFSESVHFVDGAHSIVVSWCTRGD